MGTICAAEDRHTNDFLPAGGVHFGFFEYIDDYEVAEALFDQASRMGQSSAASDALFGPFNLDYEDGYGVLIEGRDRPR